LEHYDFQEVIKVNAEKIYNQMENKLSHRNNMKKLLFICVYYGYIENGGKPEPFTLGQKFNLNKETVRRSFQLFSPTQTKYIPPTINASPKDYIPEFCQKLGLHDGKIVVINNLIDRLIKKDPELKKQTPITLAAGIMWYFMEINGIQVQDPNKTMKEITSRSMVTIKGVYKKIVLLENE